MVQIPISLFWVFIVAAAIALIGAIVFGFAAYITVSMVREMRRGLTDLVYAERTFRQILVAEHKDMVDFLQFTTDPTKWLVKQQAEQDRKDDEDARQTPEDPEANPELLT